MTSALDYGRSRVNASVDYAADGKQYGYLDVPHSRDDSAWGSIRVPVVVVKNGDGPSVLFTGGNHGDEYEGPISLLKLARELEPARVRGRVIIIPALNLPAVRAGRRTSPIDGGNMNRSFPGARDGSITAMIAHYVYTELLPLVEVVVDLHSGGKTLEFVPSVVVHRLDDRDRMTRTLDLVDAFGAPIGLVLVELEPDGLLDTAVESMGKLFISTELGGGGRVSTDTVAIADVGVRNVLRHLGVLDEPLVTRASRGLEPTRLMHTPGPQCFVRGTQPGMYEVLVDLGEWVQAGDVLGRVHQFETPERDPVEHSAPASGMLLCRHFPGLVQSGDCIGVVATDLET